MPDIKESYDKIIDMIDESIDKTWELKKEIDSIHQAQMDSLEKIFKIHEQCIVGMNCCIYCGWRHPEGKRVSGCPVCRHSFCE